jgi:hypothetical protein
MVKLAGLVLGVSAAFAEKNEVVVGVIRSLGRVEQEALKLVIEEVSFGRHRMRPMVARSRYAGMDRQRFGPALKLVMSNETPGSDARGLSVER